MILLGARILSISEVASVFPKTTFFACVIHWFVMTLWLSMYERTWFCYSSIKDAQCKIRRVMEVLFCAVLGLVFIFAFITFKDGDTKYKYTFYYTICFLENSIAIVLWSTCNYTKLVRFWWYVPLLVTTYILFFIGIFSMIVYYTKYHPEIGSINRSGNISHQIAENDEKKSPIIDKNEKSSIGVQADDSS